MGRGDYSGAPRKGGPCRSVMCFSFYSTVLEEGIPRGRYPLFFGYRYLACRRTGCTVFLLLLWVIGDPLLGGDPLLTSRGRWVWFLVWARWDWARFSYIYVTSHWDGRCPL